MDKVAVSICTSFLVVRSQENDWVTAYCVCIIQLIGLDVQLHFWVLLSYRNIQIDAFTLTLSKMWRFVAKPQQSTRDKTGAACAPALSVYSSSSLVPCSEPGLWWVLSLSQRYFTANT